MKETLGKALLIFTLLLAGYYFFFLKPQLELPNKLTKTEKVLSEHHTTLLQNRLAFVELTKLNPDSAVFNLEKSNLVGTLQKTNEEGLKALENPTIPPEVDESLSERYIGLLSETKAVYEKQNELLEEVFATNSYEAGTKILKSDESISTLTDQTNLVLEFEFWLKKINSLQ